LLYVDLASFLFETDAAEEVKRMFLNGCRVIRQHCYLVSPLNVIRAAGSREHVVYSTRRASLLSPV
jgi:hypothetical protein